MSGNTDPFLVLVDDIGALRRQIENLQRTSLDRDEAEHLNATIAKSLDNMAQTGKRLEQRLEGQLQLATAKTNRAAIEAAQDAARGAIRNPMPRSSKRPGASHRPQERPAGRRGAGSAGSGSG
jgi:ferritin-like metal-binding protein YciE